MGGKGGFGIQDCSTLRPLLAIRAGVQLLAVAGKQNWLQQGNRKNTMTAVGNG